MAKKPKQMTRVELILMAGRARVGTYPGQNRSRKFVDRKKKANKSACRGKFSR